LTPAGTKRVGLAYYVPAITQIIAGGALLTPSLGIEKWPADLIAAAVFLAIIAAGGLRSTAAAGEATL